jgi:protein-S-isoprenylcysteine O-methyltransferase Ste14
VQVPGNESKCGPSGLGAEALSAGGANVAVSFQKRWIELLYRVATGNKKVRMLLAPLGAMVFFVFVALFVVCSWLLDSWLKPPRLFSWPYNFALSVPVILIGLVLVIWCTIHFVMARGTPVPFSPPQRLLESGPYRYSRNPMLTGLFVTLFGIGILLNSTSLMFLFTPLFILLNTLELKYIEEPELEKRLGEPYVQYKKRTPMFFPQFRPQKKP